MDTWNDFLPVSPRKTSIVMWHSSSTQTWQNRWDGGEGFKDMFLRRSYPVYLWDGPRVGRANWGCAPSTYRPSYRDQGNFMGWNLGPSYLNFWNDSLFPVGDDEAWNQATRNRYVEWDTGEDVILQSDAAAIAADSGKVGDSIVYLGNSASGLRAMMTAIKSNKTNVKGIVVYESLAFVYPDNVNVTAVDSGFGPFVVPVEDFKKLARLKTVQFVWGDHRSETFHYLRESRRVAEIINSYGGNAQVLLLGKDAGLTGSSHIPFMDMDNDKVADLLEDLLMDNGLDGYA